MNWVAVYPEIALLALTCIVALADLWVRDEEKLVTYCLAQGSLFLVALAQLWYVYAGTTVYAMQRMVVADPMGHLLALFATLAMMATLVYARSYAAGQPNHLASSAFIVPSDLNASIAALIAASRSGSDLRTARPYSSLVSRNGVSFAPPCTLM